MTDQSSAGIALVDPGIRDFQHLQSAHCESGVMASMLTHYGLPMTEPMAFGLSNALGFAYIPLVKLSGMPLIAYRMPPRWIIKGLQKRIGLRMKFQTFGDPQKGMDQLDALLDSGKLVGLQTSVYWLPYFPEEMRFHFNAHNLLVIGRQKDQYAISDPLFEQPVSCPRADLRKARFAKGALAAKGMMYYPVSVPSDINYRKVVPQAIRANYKIMAKAPLPVIGIRGIRYLGKNLKRVAADPKRSQRYLPLYLSHIVRMQEEIGTGGAGFRFIYAAFLNQASAHVATDLLQEASAHMTAAGDEWRRFALTASKMSRQRIPMDVNELDRILNECADREKAVWELLRKV
ncbi:BtrH N-terminal domain-containing protein [Gilvimarinus sp. F26214L]|uniref:BtrH N-terminal domain-containing protein n=1 Tax=Gilvimarinus sp. DZF01 TaxID=3461371 RepID=UPI0040465F37